MAAVSRGDCAIDIEGVSFWYEGQSEPALDDVSLRVERGRCVVVTGASGCGKTTLTHLVNGLIPHIYEGSMTGRVHIEGNDLADVCASWIGTSVGTVFQNPRSQFVNQDVVSEIAFGCENLGIERQEMIRRVADSACALRIEPLLFRAVDELSGGQRQSVVIASAHAVDPSVLVLDEPTASLDVPSMIRLARSIERLKREGRTVLVSEHRLWWLRRVADRVVFMERGKVAGDWTGDQYAALAFSERASRGMRAWSVDEMDRMRSFVREAEDAFPDEKPNRRFSSGAADIEVRGLTVRYGRKGREALEDASLCCKGGEVVGLIGPNGAGKTTLLRCLAGLERERSGSVAVGGRPVGLGKRPDLVHLVMQEPGYQLFSDSVAGEIECSLPSGGRRRSRCGGDDEAGRLAAEVERLLGAFSLGGMRERHPLSLSGGQRQRLAIAAAAARRTPVMVLDEPTSGLDLANMAAVARLVRRAACQGASVIVVTHDYEFLTAACDRVIELEEGRVLRAYPLDEEGAARVKRRFGFGALREKE